MSKPPSKKVAGRPITDDNGNRTWEWHPDLNIDTAAVRALAEGLSVDSSPGTPESCNPYDRTAANGPSEAGTKRRTLDDMRRLSEKIKRSKHWTPRK